MAAGLGLLGAKGGAEGIDLPQCHRGALDIQLAALGEKCFLPEVFHRKQRAGAFAGGRCENRRIGEDEAVIVEIVARRLDDFSADAQNSGLPWSADPQVPVFHQELDPVLLERDGEGFFFAHFLQDFDVIDIELEAAGSTFVRSHPAGHDHA